MVSKRPPISSPSIMGVVNVTPDSFSDGGLFLGTEKAVEHGLRLVQEGADVLDIGGESTRPGSDTVSPQEEQDRALPVIEALVKRTDVLISVDTRNAQTMTLAIDAGANMVNDVTALEHDEDSLSVLTDTDVYVGLMHMQGKPQSMQDKPSYTAVVDEIYEYLQSRVQICVEAGIDKSRLIVDPGIGFGKTLEHNLTLLKQIDRFKDLDVPVLLGTSRKSFITMASEKHDSKAIDVADRMPGSIASALWGLSKGVTMFRVHDVAATKQAFLIHQSIESA